MHSPVRSRGRGRCARLLTRSLQLLVVTGRSRYAEYAPLTQALSIKAAWNGTETYVVGKRRLSVDDDSYLILNEGRTYSSVLQSDGEADSFCVFFRPKMADEVLGGMSASLTQAADNGPQGALRKSHFAENLRPHDDIVTPPLVQFARKVRGGTDEADAIEEAMQSLLQRMFGADRRLRDHECAIASTRPSTRKELLRRINWAADFISSNYATPITLDEIAAAASLSKFHLIRLFRQVHDMTPHGYLVNKRLAAANRLLDRAELDLGEIALLTGFGTRWSLFRHLRKKTGESGAALRKARRRTTEAQKGPG